MKSFELNNSNKDESIKGFIFDGKSENLMIFIGGDTDTRFTFQDLGERVSNELNIDALVFSFRGYEERKETKKEQLHLDLKEVIEYVKENYNYESFIFVSTSSGAYPCNEVLMKKEIANLVTDAIYLDPADYYSTPEGRSITTDTWNGWQEYQPKQPTVSMLIKELQSETKVHVVCFTLRNSNTTSYVHSEYELRGIDYPDKFPRLSIEMVKSFWSNAPEKNRGRYIENNKVPHAFKRDGNIEENVKEIVNLLKSILV